MTDDKVESLKKRVTERREAASRTLKANLGRQASLERRGPILPPLAGFNQASLQAASSILAAPTNFEDTGTQALYGAEADKPPERPAAPTGRWRCVVNSNVVSIDLIANISENGELSGQGTIVYVATNRIYEVSGKGDWTALPPDPEAKDWLFKFRLQPSTHAIFSWFAAPTDSPNHMQNRFIVPYGGGTVETNCERIG